MNTITPQNNNIRFTSKLNPVKAYKFVSPKGAGELVVSELNLDKEATRENIWGITKFFCDNISKSTDREIWTKYRNATTEAEKNSVIASYGKSIWSSIHNPETKDTVTLLVARDSENNIQGAHLSMGCTCVPNCLKSTLYLHSGSVAPEYRGQGLAGSMTRAVLDANKGTFTDAYSTCSDMAVGQLAKQGFKKLNPNDNLEKKIIDYFHKTRSESFNKLTDMYVVLQPDKPRWTEGAVVGIKQWEKDAPIRFAKKLFRVADKKISSLFGVGKN